MKVIYIAGPFRGPSHWAIENNIRVAERLALDVWRLGAVGLCPHTNTRFYQNAAPDAVWLDGDLELVRRCDALLLTPTAGRSTGATAEATFARQRRIPVFQAVWGEACDEHGQLRFVLPVAFLHFIHPTEAA